MSIERPCFFAFHRRMHRCTSSAALSVGLSSDCGGSGIDVDRTRLFPSTLARRVGTGRGSPICAAGAEAPTPTRGNEVDRLSSLCELARLPDRPNDGLFSLKPHWAGLGPFASLPSPPPTVPPQGLLSAFDRRKLLGLGERWPPAFILGTSGLVDIGGRWVTGLPLSRIEGAFGGRRAPGLLAPSLWMMLPGRDVWLMASMASIGWSRMFERQRATHEAADAGEQLKVALQRVTG